MAVIAEFYLKGTPKLYNAIGRKSWHIKATEARVWKSHVISECCRLKIDHLKLIKAKLTFIRQTCRECDFDSLVISFKHCLDGLVAAQVIIDDKPSIIGQPSYSWEKRPTKLGARIFIKIESVE